MDTRIYIGIDPGLTGAVAVIYPSGGTGIYDVPTFIVEKAKSKGRPKAGHRTLYHVDGMVDILRGIMAAHWNPEEPCPLAIAIEHQQPMPASLHGRSQGNASVFAMGYGYGIWIGVLHALGLQYEPVRPAAWKPAMVKGGPRDKDGARMKAIQMFPTARGDLARKKDHNRAEALLIAAYLRRATTTGGLHTAQVEDEDDNPLEDRPF